ncbi:hypothetical protein U1Q18_006577 [Sarracenia purpurea var. burkii]
MVCLGLLFGCRRFSVQSYVLLALVIVAIVIAMRVLCFALHRLLIGAERHGESRSDHHGTTEMQLRPQNREWALPSHSLPRPTESKFVILAGENHASLIAQPVPFSQAD